MGGAYFSNSCLPKSLLFNLGVLSGILSAQILAASVTPFVSKTHIENSQCGWQSTKAPEKPTLFLVCSMILTYFSCVVLSLRGLSLEVTFHCINPLEHASCPSYKQTIIEPLNEPQPIPEQIQNQNT